jgi:hypothetical protein
LADILQIKFTLEDLIANDKLKMVKISCALTAMVWVAPIAVWTNGDQISYYQRKDPNYFEDIPVCPMLIKPWQIFSRSSSPGRPDCQ